VVDYFSYNNFSVAT